MRDRSITAFLNGRSVATTGLILRNAPRSSDTRLSDILETGDIQEKYYLSPKACAGILRRAERRGKALPPALREALTAVAGADTPEGDAKMT